MVVSHGIEMNHLCLENTHAIGISEWVLAEESQGKWSIALICFDFLVFSFVIGSFFGNIIGCDVAMSIFYL